MGFFDFVWNKSTARVPRSAAGHFHLSVEGLESRIVPYSLSGNAWPNPQLITISFVPDGTVLGSNSNGYIYSNLFATFNGKFGSAAAWENQILKAAQTWAQQTNINFTVVPDDGADIGSGNYQQGDPNHGDIRIGGYNFNSTTLAQAFMPPPVNNFSLAGDIQFNTGRTFNIGTTYDLNTVALHEFGHALGLYHNPSQSSAVMYPNYNGIKNSLSSDDTNGIRAIYSGGQARTADTFDGGSGTQALQGGVLSPVTAPASGGGGGGGGLLGGLLGLVGGLLGGGGSSTPSNDSFSSAAPLDSYVDPTTQTAALTGLDVSTTSDLDYYSVAAPQGTSGIFTVTAQSSGLSLLNPVLTVYAADQRTVLGTATGSGDFGSTLTLTLNNVTAGQKFYVKVAGADSSAFGTGAYGLALDFGSPLNMPAIPLPNTQLLNGNVISSGGGQMMNEMSAEVQVNTFTAGDQTTQGPRQVGMDANGNSVVVWSSYGQEVSGWGAAGQAVGGWGVYAQRLNASGAPLGPEFRVNTTTQADQNAPTVAVNADGSFLVVWQSNNQDGDGEGIYAQRYDANGNAVGGEFRVNTTTKGDQISPSVATDGQGDYVVTWASQGQDGSGWGVYAQRYNAAGVAQGGEFRVNTTTKDDQTNPQVAEDANGNFVVVWQSHNQDGGGWGIYAQRYDANGNTLGGEFRVNTTTKGDQTNPAVAMTPDGNVVVAWQSQGQDGSGWGIYAQRYDASGAAHGAEFQVNVTTAGDQEYPSVAVAPDNSFIIGWQSNGQDGSGWGVYARQYNGVGIALGGDMLVSSTTAGDQVHISWAIDPNGNAVAVWSGNGMGDSSGVFLQRFNLNVFNGTEALTADGFSDVSDVQRDLAGHQFPCMCPLCRGAAAAAQTGNVQVAPGNSGEASLPAAPVQAQSSTGPVLSPNFSEPQHGPATAPLGTLGTSDASPGTPAGNAGPAAHAQGPDGAGNAVQAATPPAVAAELAATPGLLSTVPGAAPLAVSTGPAAATFLVREAALADDALTPPAAPPEAAFVLTPAAPPLYSLVLELDPVLGVALVPGWVPGDSPTAGQATAAAGQATAPVQVAAAGSPPAPRAAVTPPTADPQAEATLWPRVCAECFTEVGWLEDGLPALAAEQSSGDGRPSALSAALVAGLAAVVAGSWEKQARQAYARNRRPGLRPEA